MESEVNVGKGEKTVLNVPRGIDAQIDTCTMHLETEGVESTKNLPHISNNCDFGPEPE